MGKLLRINPANQLIIQSKCVDGCELFKSISYQYDVYFSKSNVSNRGEQDWEMLNDTFIKNYLMGEKSMELTISSQLFDNFLGIIYWKVDFTIQILTHLNKKIDGLTTMNLKINEKPYNGSCSVNMTEGFAMVDYFLIECMNWADIDGFIVRYEYFGKQKKHLSSKTLILKYI